MNEVVGRQSRGVWDGGRRLDELSLGDEFEPSAEYELTLRDGDSCMYFHGPTERSVFAVGGVVVAITCAAMFRKGPSGENILGQTLADGGAELGVTWEPDEMVPSSMWHAVGTYVDVVCVGDLIQSVALVDFDLIEE